MPQNRDRGAQLRTGAHNEMSRDYFNPMKLMIGIQLGLTGSFTGAAHLAKISQSPVLPRQFSRDPMVIVATQQPAVGSIRSAPLLPLGRELAVSIAWFDTILI